VHAGHVQALDDIIFKYKTRHAECVNSSGLPPKYVLMSMTDDYAGLGNQLPGIITGEAAPHPPF
jgi:hypothetical protein